MHKMSEIRVQSLVGENPLEEGMAPHSSILAWKNPMDKGACRGLQSLGVQSWTQLIGLNHTYSDGNTAHSAEVTGVVAVSSGDGLQQGCSGTQVADVPGDMSRHI